MHYHNKNAGSTRVLLLLRKFGTVCFLILHTGWVVAQTDQPGYFTRGRELFNQKKYYEALQYFDKYLSTEIKTTPRSQPFAVKKKVAGKSNLNLHNEAVYLLAECYRLTNNYTQAEKWYSQAMSFSRDAYPACPYWYGVSLRANQKYEEAFRVLSAFRESHTAMGVLLVGVDKELENLKFIQTQLQKEKDDFFVTRQPLSGRTTAYAQSATGINHTVYTAVYEDRDNDQYVARLFETNGNTATGNDKMLPAEDIPGTHSGLASFSKDGKKMFFTRWLQQGETTRSAIYSANRTDTGWSTPQLMPEPVNMAGSNAAQPFITPDGKYLLFSSNREGGVGNYDIWYASLDAAFNVLLVTNAGNTVNTTGDERSPSYHQASRTLLFSSNGHVGMGGYDIFSAKGDFQLSDWDKPVNAGKPINSSKDDLYFISTDEDNLWNTGWLSSDRATDCCLELFAVRQDNAQFISGMVTDCMNNLPLAGVKLTVSEPGQQGAVLLQQQTNPDGSYSFELRNKSRFDVSAEKNGYQTAHESFKVYFDGGKDSVNNNIICLSPDLPEKAKSDELISGESYTLAKFSFNRSALGNRSLYELDSLAAMMVHYPSMVIEVGGYTDGKGSEAYNIKLAQKRVDACIAYLIKSGISKDRLIGKAYGECCPLEPEKINGQDNPAARQRNRRVEYRLVSGGQ